MLVSKWSGDSGEGEGEPADKEIDMSSCLDAILGSRRRPARR